MGHLKISLYLSKLTDKTIFQCKMSLLKKINLRKTDMKKFLLIATTVLLSITGIAQNGFYLGYENGFFSERYDYVNSKAKIFSQSSIGEILGGYFGFKYDTYTIKTGFYGLFSSIPLNKYDYSNFSTEKTLSFTSGQESWLIPLRFGKEFLMVQEKLFIKPEIGFNVTISRDYSENPLIKGAGENITPFPGSNYFVPSGSDSTRIDGYVSSKVNFSIEPAISFGYRFKKKADIYLKCIYIASFNPTYYETITHYTETETVHATRSVSNAILYQIGLRYYFAKRE